MIVLSDVHTICICFCFLFVVFFLLAPISSCCCPCSSRPRFAPGVTIEEDNCCGCNAIAIKRHFLDENMNMVDIVYTSCHDAVSSLTFCASYHVTESKAGIKDTS